MAGGVGAGAISANALEHLFESAQRDEVTGGAHGGDQRGLVGGAAGESRIGVVFRMADGDAEFGMVEGGAFEADAVVGEGFEESDERGFLRRRGVEGADVAVLEVAAASVEVDYLFERCLTAGVEVGSGEFDVAQSNGLEVAVAGA